MRGGGGVSVTEQQLHYNTWGNTTLLNLHDAHICVRQVGGLLAVGQREVEGVFEHFLSWVLVEDLTQDQVSLQETVHRWPCAVTKQTLNIMFCFMLPCFVNYNAGNFIFKLVIAKR